MSTFPRDCLKQIGSQILPWKHYVDTVAWSACLCSALSQEDQFCRSRISKTGLQFYRQQISKTGFACLVAVMFLCQSPCVLAIMLFLNFFLVFWMSPWLFDMIYFFFFFLTGFTIRQRARCPGQWLKGLLSVKWFCAPKSLSCCWWVPCIRVYWLLTKVHVWGSVLRSRDLIGFLLLVSHSACWFALSLGFDEACLPLLFFLASLLIFLKFFSAFVLFLLRVAVQVVWEQLVWCNIFCVCFAVQDSIPIEYLVDCYYGKDNEQLYLLAGDNK